MVKSEKSSKIAVLNSIYKIGVGGLLLNANLTIGSNPGGSSYYYGYHTSPKSIGSLSTSSCFGGKVTQLGSQYRADADYLYFEPGLIFRVEGFTIPPADLPNTIELTLNGKKYPFVTKTVSGNTVTYSNNDEPNYGGPMDPFYAYRGKTFPITLIYKS